MVPAQARAAARRRCEPEPDDAPTLPLFITATPPPESTRTRVRPYVRTGGRTKARADLAVETLVSIPSPRPPLEDPEHVALGDVVGDPRSVAEVAALLSVPLGVARVIIDDMAGAGLLLVHPRAVAASGAPSRDIMQRVLEGLHEVVERGHDRDVPCHAPHRLRPRRRLRLQDPARRARGRGARADAVAVDRRARASSSSGSRTATTPRRCGSATASR